MIRTSPSEEGGFDALTVFRNVITACIGRAKFTNGAAPRWKTIVVDRKTRELLDRILPPEDYPTSFIIDSMNIEDAREKRQKGGLYILQAREDLRDILVRDIREKMFEQFSVIWAQARPDIATLDSPQLPEQVPAPTPKGKSRQPPPPDRFWPPSEGLPLNYQPFTQMMPLDCCPVESHLFDFRDPESISKLYTPDKRFDDVKKEYLQKLAGDIRAICKLLGEDPIIRVQMPPPDTPPNRKGCAEELGKLLALNRSFVPDIRSNMIILERGLDLHEPLRHELSYQATVYDLLNIDQFDRYSLSASTGVKPGEKVKTLDDKDPLWKGWKHLWIRDVFSAAMNPVNEIKGDAISKVVDSTDPATVSMQDYRKALLTMGKSEEGMERISLHIEICENIIKTLHTGTLIDMAITEQNFALGKNPDDETSPSTLTAKLVEMLKADRLSTTDKWRLIYIFFIYRNGLTERDLEMLARHANVYPNYKTRDLYHFLNGLFYMGGPLIRPSFQSGILLRDEKPPLLGEAANVASDEPWCRYAPTMKAVIENLVQGSLPSGDMQDGIVASKKSNSTEPEVRFGFAESNGLEQYKRVLQELNKEKTIGAGASTWASSAKPRLPKVFVVMLGGATYGELRWCYELGKVLKRTVILITPEMVRPRRFLDRVSALMEAPRFTRPAPVPIPQILVPVQETRPMPHHTNSAPLPATHQDLRPPGAAATVHATVDETNPKKKGSFRKFLGLKR